MHNYIFSRALCSYIEALFKPSVLDNLKSLKSCHTRLLNKYILQRFLKCQEYEPYLDRRVVNVSKTRNFAKRTKETLKQLFLFFILLSYKGS